ncbi:Krueppel-like factor 11 [Escovopsis weberi]|uniref:Krueppel-like factor 11 n=1 Tax=Escovopsis weberi TaxID=150374 RepID=A0A0M8MZ63_ESCWE|nr:Krueppel-like factor 11 [Escovopsis weberi]
MLKRHIRTHTKPTKCPKEGCDAAGDFGKFIARHVWTDHTKWAEETNFPRIDGKCPHCGRSFKRKDFVTRHVREQHPADGEAKVRRKRGPKG